jgi:hypothetical protein
VPQGWVGYGTWVANSACTKMVGIEIHADDWFPLSDWKKFAEMFHAKPRCRLFSVDLATGARSVILEQRGWLGHPQYRPFDDTTVAYCHEGPHDLVDARMWFIDEDGTHKRCGKTQAAGESCTHEFWVPDGSAMVYVSYTKGEPERWICSLDPVTLANRKLMAMPPCSHLMSNATGTPRGRRRLRHAHRRRRRLRPPDRQRIPSAPVRHSGAAPRAASGTNDSSWGVYKGATARSRTRIRPFTPDERQVLSAPTATPAPGLYLVDIAPWRVVAEVPRRAALGARRLRGAASRGTSPGTALTLRLGRARKGGPRHRSGAAGRTASISAPRADLDRAMALGDCGPSCCAYSGRRSRRAGRGARGFRRPRVRLRRLCRAYSPQAWGGARSPGRSRRRASARRAADGGGDVKIPPRTAHRRRHADAGSPTARS